MLKHSNKYTRWKKVLSGMFGALLWLVPVASSAQSTGPSLSASMEADRDTIFLHETFWLTLSIHSTGVRLGKSFDLRALPDRKVLLLKGFRELPIERKREGGQVRETRRFRCEVHARMPGNIALSPVLRVRILKRERMVVGWRWVEVSRDVRVRSLALSIKPLPESGKPEGFSGAMGRFSFDVDMVPTDVAVGDLITAVMKIGGEGYLEGLLPPRVSPGRNFKVYDPKLISGEGAGDKVFEQTLIPQSTNAVEVPAVSFSYFDPRARSYKTVVRGPFPLTFHAPRSVSPKPYRPARPRPAEPGEMPELETIDLLNSLGWIIIALAVSFVGSIVIVFWLTRRLRAGVVAVVLILTVIVMAFSMYRAVVKSGLFTPLEMVVTRRETARFAPAYSAMNSFDLPKGSIVRVHESLKDWVRISLGDKRGWVPLRAVSR